MTQSVTYLGVHVTRAMPLKYRLLRCIIVHVYYTRFRVHAVNDRVDSTVIWQFRARQPPNRPYTCASLNGTNIRTPAIIILTRSLFRKILRVYIFSSKHDCAAFTRTRYCRCNHVAKSVFRMNENIFKSFFFYPTHGQHRFWIFERRPLFAMSKTSLCFFSAGFFLRLNCSSKTCVFNYFVINLLHRVWGNSQCI